MEFGRLLTQARLASGQSQQELARRARTSRPTLSAYENNRKSPSIETAARLLAETGHDLTIEKRITFTEYTDRRGRPHVVPDRLPQLPVERALATVTLPLHLDWSTPCGTFRLVNRDDRSRVYAIVLREGLPEDILNFVDGVLLVDLWSEIAIPADIREMWSPLVEAKVA